MGYLLDELERIEAEVKGTYNLTTIELAMTKTANEWKKQKDNSTNDSQRIYYNALQRLREAIDKNHKNDISGWEFVVSELRRINYR